MDNLSNINSKATVHAIRLIETLSEGQHSLITLFLSSGKGTAAAGRVRSVSERGDTATAGRPIRRRAASETATGSSGGETSFHQRFLTGVIGENKAIVSSFSDDADYKEVGTLLKAFLDVAKAYDVAWVFSECTVSDTAAFRGHLMAGFLPVSLSPSNNLLKQQGHPLFIWRAPASTAAREVTRRVDAEAQGIKIVCLSQATAQQEECLAALWHKHKPETSPGIDAFQNPDFSFIAVGKDGQVVGALLAKKVKDGHLVEDNLLFAQPVGGNMIQSELLKAFRDAAAGSGVKCISFTCQPTNVERLAVALSAGFTPSALDPHHYKLSINLQERARETEQLFDYEIVGGEGKPATRRLPETSAEVTVKGDLLETKRKIASQRWKDVAPKQLSMRKQMNAQWQQVAADLTTTEPTPEQPSAPAISSLWKRVGLGLAVTLLLTLFVGGLTPRRRRQIRRSSVLGNLSLDYEVLQILDYVETERDGGPSRTSDPPGATYTTEDLGVSHKLF